MTGTSSLRTNVTSPCLDEETILAFCRGDLASEGRLVAHQHIAECDECRALVSAVARSSIVDHRASAPDDVVRTPPPSVGASSVVGIAVASSTAMAATTPVGDRADHASGQQARVSPAERARELSPVGPGDRVAGKYVVEHVLGAGGMGVVVAARHTQLDQRVALKFLLPEACKVPGAVARFLREGRAAARITSEHVARVIDTGELGESGGAPFLVMEFLDGTDLGALTAARGPLGPSDAVAYVLQACEAIVEAHAIGIVHRDLKPANLFLTVRKDGSPLVKVLDFGISKADEDGASLMTSASMLMGSPRYMSPEQMISAKDVDARTDVWSLGVILHELVTGRPVWEADTVQGLCLLVASVPAPRVRLFAPDAPAALEEAILRCLAKSRDERLASVADLALALAPVAPPAAQTSIERILRVAGRASEIRMPSGIPSSGSRTTDVSTPNGAAGQGTGEANAPSQVAMDLATSATSLDPKPTTGAPTSIVSGAAPAARLAESPPPVRRSSGLVALFIAAAVVLFATGVVMNLPQRVVRAGAAHHEGDPPLPITTVSSGAAPSSVVAAPATATAAGAPADVTSPSTSASSGSPASAASAPRSAVGASHRASAPAASGRALPAAPRADGSAGKAADPPATPSSRALSDRK